MTTLEKLEESEETERMLPQLVLEVEEVDPEDLEHPEPREPLLRPPPPKLKKPQLNDLDIDYYWKYVVISAFNSSASYFGSYVEGENLNSFNYSHKNSRKN